MVKLQEIQFTRDNRKKKQNYRNDRNVSCMCMCVRVSVLSSVYPDSNCYTEQAASCKCILTFIPRSAGHSLSRHTHTQTHTNILVVAGNYVFLVVHHIMTSDCTQKGCCCYCCCYCWLVSPLICVFSMRMS